MCKKAGAKPKLLKQTDDINVLKNYLNMCDAFVMPGGADINPNLYGEPKNDACGKIDDIRDNMELPLIKMIINAKKPLLCICRGHQLLNVAMGGTLYQDISKNQVAMHSDFKGRKGATHSITVYNDTTIKSLFKKNEIFVNSIHHQAINKLGENLVISAISSDGFVEAVELNDIFFCIGVQWHPEHMAKKSQQHLLLFIELVKNCE